MPTMPLRDGGHLCNLTSDLCNRFPNLWPSHILVIPMLKKNRLFTPGPTPLLPQAQMAMASYGAPSHRRFPRSVHARSCRREGVPRHEERRARADLVGHGFHGSLGLEPD